MLQTLDGLYRLQKKDVRRAGAVLADAFEHDPVWHTIMGDLPLEKRVYAFETPVRYCLQYGEVYAPTDKLEGIAVWVPGEYAKMTLWRGLRSGSVWPGMKLGTKVAKKMMPVFAPIEADRKKHMCGKAYVYLLALGVAPDLQGQGFGGKLLRALIEESERSGVAIYLETETEDNLRMYEHLGFQVIQKITLPVVNLPMWELVRGG